MNRPRRLAVLSVVGALAVAACTPTEDPSPTDSTADAGASIGVDPDVEIGVLENGLTYYVRANSAPGGRAQLRLAVRAGSIQESADQRGVAHFLEHMAFNGTAGFPGHELVLALQRFGAEFGPDINAYTTYEETVYEIELPTDDPEILELGLDVLYDWATAITLDPDEVDLERGVLVEEWRLRDQSFWSRYFAGVSEVLLADTAYDDRDPLGSPEEVAATTPQDLAAFYERWYRPDTMALIAVGDFDPTVVADQIRERFGSISPVESAAPVPQPVTEPSPEPTFFVIADPEYPQAWAELNYPLPAIAAPATVAGVREELALALAWRIIVERLAEESLRGGVPYFNPSFAANPLVRTQRTDGLAAFALPEDLGEAAEHLLREVASAAFHGFDEEEFARAVAAARSEIDFEFDVRATTQDADYADRYVEHFLGGLPIPAAEEWHRTRLELLEEMTPEAVREVFADTVESTAPFVILVAPEAAASVIPTELELRAIVDRVASVPPPPRKDPATTITGLIEQPEPAEVLDRRAFSDTPLTQLTLENGLRVVLLPTTIRDDGLVVWGSSPGGWAQLPESDVAEAQLASEVTTLSGVGEVDQVALDRYLSEFNVFVTPFIDEAEEGIVSGGASADLELILQLIHLYMTEPRFEERAAQIMLSGLIPYAADPDQVPDLAVSTALADARFRGDARFAPFPPLAELESLDLERAEDVYRDRFDDPADFAFTIVGDFDEAVAEDLARRYLGTIPGSDEVEEPADVRPPPPEGVVDRTVEAGTGVLGGVTFLFSTDLTLDPLTRIQVDLARLILQQRLTEVIREALAASYSPVALTDVIEEPRQAVETTIRISGDPAGLDQVVAATLAELDSLRTEGPTADELGIAAEQLRRDYELVSNEFLAHQVLFAAHHPFEQLSDVTTRIFRTGEASREDLRRLFETLLPEDGYILIRLVPAPG